MFQQMAAGRAANLGLEEGAIAGADTARQRAQARAINAVPLTEQQQQRMAEEAYLAEGKRRSFEQFQGY
jgi:hypothetical protein